MAETEQQTEVAQDAATEVQDAELEDVQEQTVPAGDENIDLLLDINMPITVKLGSAVVPFKQLLQMGPGSVLQLDKVIGEPAELFVQDIKFATADIVVVDGRFAARIREVLGTESLQAASQQPAE